MDRTIPPHVVAHNSVSVDGCVTGFRVDMGAHYGTAASFTADATLVGSRTAVAGLETYGDGAKAESAGDLHRPPSDGRAAWAFVDSTGRLHGRLHGFRGSEFGGDPIVLVAASTPPAYIDYLVSREYRHHVVGDERVNLQRALSLLGTTYGVRTLLVDSGPGLFGALYAQGLLDEISLIVEPHLVGPRGTRLVTVDGACGRLQLIHHAPLDSDRLWLRYRVIHGAGEENPSASKEAY